MLHKRQQVLSESESNWDSSDEEKSSVIETPRATEPQKDMFTAKTAGDPSKTSQPKPSPRPDRQSTVGKNSSSTSQSGMKSGISVFNDRGRRHDNEGESYPIKDRRAKPGKDQPPYDFKGIVGPDKPSPSRQPPGKGRKGHSYDPDSDLQPNSSENAVLGSWDDSDAEEETLAAIRANIAKDSAKSGPTDPSPPAGSNNRRDRNNDRNNDSGRAKDRKGKKEDTGLWPGKKEDSGLWPGKKEDAGLWSGRSSGRKKNQEHLSISTRQLVPEAEDSGSETRAEPDKPGTEMVPQYSPGNESSRSVYPFHQGTVKYLYAQDGSGQAVMPTIADKSEVLVRRGVQEMFGVLRLLVDVFVILAVELARFVFRQILQNLVVGLVVVMGDHFFKPLVAAVFNSFLQPVLMLLWNVATATRTVFGPLVDILRGVALQIAVVLRAFRLVEVNWKTDRRDYGALQEV
ncbi:PREDICTED: uncharacterized protein LOC109481690 [Branchiostoma belcheri]|uniref:Uncharacterized protein LOC109481690 n=1 Tax=Branchiostoma belcheri TaxID=7741 RepID=A0A6P5ADI5_BRABE|nr:PREDICTED: uncharacterized protein LOC109481690 [Branchiostoma belcheri]